MLSMHHARWKHCLGEGLGLQRWRLRLHLLCAPHWGRAGAGQAEVEPSGPVDEDGGAAGAEGG